jgi:hypothetical protein
MSNPILKKSKTLILNCPPGGGQVRIRENPLLRIFPFAYSKEARGAGIWLRGVCASVTVVDRFEPSKGTLWEETVDFVAR